LGVKILSTEIKGTSDSIRLVVISYGLF